MSGKISKYNGIEDFKMLIKAAKIGANLICFDLETTGLSRKIDRILSFSAIKCVLRGTTFVEIDRINMYINPGFHIPEKITSINHIADDMVANCPMENEAAEIIRNFLGDNPFLCGYNSNSFDIPFLNEMFLRAFGEELKYIGNIDVMRMAKEIYDFQDYKLETVAHACGADIGLVFHNSIDDVIATLKVLNIMIPDYVAYIKGNSELIRLQINGYRIFQKSHRVNRIYFNTYPYTKTYYDIYKSEWISDLPKADLRAVRKDAFSMMHVSNEKELEHAVRVASFQ